jgi:hypothetical protein
MDKLFVSIGEQNYEYFYFITVSAEAFVGSSLDLVYSFMKVFMHSSEEYEGEMLE